MSEQATGSTTFGRRTFLKGSAATLGLAAVSGSRSSMKISSA